MAEEGNLTRHHPQSSISDSLGTTAPSLIVDDGMSNRTADEEGSLNNMSLLSSTRSLNPSEYQCIHENGRTYHQYHAGKYHFPNDAEEQERMDFQHELYLHLADQKLYLAPLPWSPRRVLDIGTGTGIWAIQFAQQHTKSQVIGTDLSPIQPPYIPTNCSFEIDDAEDEWTYDKPFDFIHGRGIFPIFADPAFFIREAYKHLSPGGWLEIQDPTFPLQFANDEAPPDCHLKRWSDLLIQASIAAGRPYTNGQHYKRWLTEAGFEEVQEVRFFWLTSPWAKGAYHKITAEFVKENIMRGALGISLKPLTSIGMTIEEINELCVKVQSECGDIRVKAYLPITYTFGRKPSR